MADVYAVFGTLLALGIVFPGMLLAHRLLFPQFVKRAQERVLTKTGASFGIGVLGVATAGLPVIVLLALPFGPVKFVGGMLLMLSLAFASLGAAGVAGAMAANYREASGEGMSEIAAFVRGALALELAAAFPFLGWFLIIPGAIVISLGAALGALLRARTQSTEAAARTITPDERDLIHEPQSA